MIHILILLTSSSLLATEPVTLQQAMEAAASRPDLVAAHQQAESLRQQAATVRKLSSMPQVEAILGYQYANPVRKLQTPIGVLSLGDDSTGRATLTLNQPIYDPVNRRYTAPALDLSAQAQDLSAEYLRQDLATQAGNAFIQVLRIDAQLAATRAFIKSLEKRTAEVEALVNEGRALRADLLKITLNRDDAKLGETRLLNLRQVATLDLGRTMGKDSPVEPSFDPKTLPQEPPTSQPTSDTIKNRPDLQAIQTQAQALTLQQSAIHAERLPRLDAQITWEGLEPSPFADASFFQGAIALTWKPFAGGSRKTRAAAINAQKRATLNHLTEAQRGVALAIQSALAEWKTAAEAIRVRTSDVAQAQETLRVESVRYQNGRATLNDVLQFEALLRERRTLKNLAELDLLSAWLQYQKATGQL